MPTNVRYRGPQRRDEGDAGGLKLFTGLRAFWLNYIKGASEATSVEQYLAWYKANRRTEHVGEVQHKIALACETHPRLMTAVFAETDHKRKEQALEAIARGDFDDPVVEHIGEPATKEE
jgi:hypothetical protein